uniref:Enoyl reductase (ER) domain-containing protein n=2 Tax=Clastoptera arizonana TaxID=38151 RepID=A0A1B6E5Z1_9HEMI
MDAIQFDPLKKTLTLIKTDVPSKIRANEVLVKVAYAGVCGTDLHIIEGKFPCCNNLLILGHEISGIASSVGIDVKHIKKGDRVVIDPNRGCYVCSCCTSGSYHLCDTEAINTMVGIFQNGGWAQYCKVPANQVYKIPDSITLKQGVLIEPLSCLVHGWERVAPIEIGSNILVTGAGIIGNLWSSVLHHSGHRSVTVSEPIVARRGYNQKLETGYKCVAPEDIKKMKVSDPDFGFDICIDCSGDGPAIEEAITLLNAGGKICIFGITSPEVKISVSPFDMYKKESTILATKINKFGVLKALKLSEAMGKRYLDYERLGVEVYSLQDHKEALASLKQGNISKVVFQIAPELE